MVAERRGKSSCTDQLDRELLQRYKHGDEAAFEVLLEIHTGLINSWVKLVLKDVPRANAEDLGQEARRGFFEAARKYQPLKSNANFHALARIRAVGRMLRSSEIMLVGEDIYRNYKTVRETKEVLMEDLDRWPSIDELAKATGLSPNQVKTAQSVVVCPAALDENVDVVAPEAPDTSQYLSAAISQLSDEQQEVIIRRYEGKKLKEIAAELGKSLEAVKKLNQRANARLRVILGGKEPKQ